MNEQFERDFQRIMAEPVNREVMKPDELRNMQRLDDYFKRLAEHQKKKEPK